MKAINIQRPSWKETLKRHAPLVLPCAHNALASRIIERAGFPAYQVGGFAVVGALHAVPDIDLEHLGEKRDAARQIIRASPLPVLVDGDDGYGDAKNVTRTVQEYEALGASALFLEDQTSPKRCGHMAGKQVIPMEIMERKIRAAVAARASSDFFLLARTDAIEPHGVDDAITRAERYLKAGADGVYVEGPRSVKELETVGKALGGAPLATSILENGGLTPWLSPDDMHKLGFSMILYPTTVLFRVVRAMEEALDDLKNGRPMDVKNAVNMKQFEEIVDLQYWSEIEKRFDH